MIKKGEIEINTEDEWEKHAGPVKKVHWKEFRSAKENAKIWLNGGKPSIPEEVKRCIESHDNFSEIVEWKVEPEYKSRFDDFGGPSNLDLVGEFKGGEEKYFIGIEAKADEPYSEFNIREKFESAIEKKIKIPKSRQIDRIVGLSRSLFHVREGNLPKISLLKYQLLTGLAGTISEAGRRGFKKAIFLIHEFETKLTLPEKHQQNQKELNAFIHRITNGRNQSIEDGDLLGPIKIPGQPLFDSVPILYIGKVISKIP